MGDSTHFSTGCPGAGAQADLGCQAFPLCNQGIQIKCASPLQGGWDLNLGVESTSDTLVMLPQLMLLQPWGRAGFGPVQQCTAGFAGARG